MKIDTRSGKEGGGTIGKTRVSAVKQVESKGLWRKRIIIWGKCDEGDDGETKAVAGVSVCRLTGGLIEWRGRELQS